jgi:hypothetical protein
MKSTTLLLAIGIIAATFSGCSKGDAGAAGPQGPAGANGINGTNGTNGSSNVSITSISVSPGDWNANGSSNWYYNTTVSVPTTDVCNVYVSADGSSFLPLPATSSFYENDELSYRYQTGYNIQLNYYNPGGEAIAKTLYYKIADIPPAEMALHPNTNWNDYSQVNAIMQAEAIHSN